MVMFEGGYRCSAMSASNLGQGCQLQSDAVDFSRDNDTVLLAMLVIENDRCS